MSGFQKSFFRRIWLRTAVVLAGFALMSQQLAQAQNAEQILAQQSLRLNEMEQVIRMLQGRVDVLENKNAQLEDLLKRLSDDVEFRLQELETGKRADLAPQAGEALTQNSVPPQASSSSVVSAPVSSPLQQGVSQNELNGLQRESVRDLTGFQSVSELLGTQVTGVSGGSSVVIERRVMRQVGAVSGVPDGQPFSLDGTSQAHVAPMPVIPQIQQPVMQQDMRAQMPADTLFSNGYSAILRGEYDVAERDFQRFINLYPAHPLTPTALYWFGEALFSQGKYEDAANLFMNASSAFKDHPKAPDALLRLGISQAKLGQKSAACATYAQLQRDFSSLPDADAVSMRVRQEVQAAQC